MAAIKLNGYNLRYADDKLQKDKEIVLEAVKNDGQTLQYVNENFKDDYDIVLAAVKKIWTGSEICER